MKTLEFVCVIMFYNFFPCIVVRFDVREMEERKSMIDTCNRLVVVEGECRRLLVVVAKL